MPSSSKDDHDPKFGGPLETTLTGSALLCTPHLNKGSAFTPTERTTFKLHGLLPPNIQSLDEQVHRAYDQYTSRPSALAKNTFLTSLKEQNEVLYYRLIISHLKEMFPIIYTPTEGDAIANYSRLFRRPEGLFLNIGDVDRVGEDVKAWGEGRREGEEVQLIIVSDGEQILGIGDQGVGGVLISIAKGIVYTVCAGLDPGRILPVVLDAGTNNQELLDDELYLGLRRPRVRGKEYDGFVDTFVRACRENYPNAYLHFEDFGLDNARRILDRYTNEIACFNDDVQGTGAVTLAAIYAAFKVSGVKWDEARFVMFGAGTAGTGIADQVADAIKHETGKSEEEALKQIWCIDKSGLLLSDSPHLTTAQHRFARKDISTSDTETKDLLAVIQNAHPHVLIGTSTSPGAFTQEIVQEMSKQVSRPIIFPLSNPTRLHEAKPQDLYDWSEGRALVATGSPFEPVKFRGEEYEIAECNNSVTFPGIALGAILSRTKLLTPALLVAAVKSLSDASPAVRGTGSALLPDVTEVRDVSVKIAMGVVRAAEREGLSRRVGIPREDEGSGGLEEWIKGQMWGAEYRELRLVGE